MTHRMHAIHYKFMFRSKAYKKQLLFIDFSFAPGLHPASTQRFGFWHIRLNTHSPYLFGRETLIIYYGFSFCFAEQRQKGHTCCFSMKFTRIFYCHFEFMGKPTFVNKSLINLIEKLIYIASFFGKIPTDRREKSTD